MPLIGRPEISPSSTIDRISISRPSPAVSMRRRLGTSGGPTETACEERTDRALCAAMPDIIESDDYESPALFWLYREIKRLTLIVHESELR